MNTFNNKRELMIGLGVTFIGLVLYFIILPWQIDIVADDSSVTPALVPKLTAGAVILVGIIMTVSLLISNKREVVLNAKKLSKRQKVNIIISIFILSAYLFLLNVVGFNISTTLFLMSLTTFMGARKIWIILTVSVLSTALIFIVFDKMAHVPLPFGALFE